jgi:hypothetical protein
MARHSLPPTVDEIKSLLGEKVVESWNQERVTLWLKEKGWEQFAFTFKGKIK